MHQFTIYIVVYIAMIANFFWEAYSEGRNAWDKGKLGWKIKIGNYTVLTAYHFYLFIIMWPVLLSLPLFLNGWDIRLFGILLSAYISGLVIQDFFWYVVNPVVKVKELNSDFAIYYPRLKIGKIKIPIGYFIGIILAVVINMVLV